MREVQNYRGTITRTSQYMTCSPSFLYLVNIFQCFSIESRNRSKSIRDSSDRLPVPFHVVSRACTQASKCKRDMASQLLQPKQNSLVHSMNWSKIETEFLNKLRSCMTYFGRKLRTYLRVKRLEFRNWCFLPLSSP